MAASDVSDGPVLNFINKRIRNLRKKQNRIAQMEEGLSQGKPILKEQEDFFRSKPSIIAAIDELEKLRQPLAAAVSEEINLAVQHHQVSASPTLTAADSDVTDEDKEQKAADVEPESSEHASGAAEDLLILLYFASMFDVKSQSDFTSTMLVRTHERGCCLTYDYVTDDEATDLLGERDLDLISALGGLLISRPVDSSLSHKNALQSCIERAKLWLAESEQPIDSNSNITYAGLRAKLRKIMASDYFTTTPEMRAPVEVAAAAAAGNFSPYQVPVTTGVEESDSGVEYQQKEEDATNFEGNESYDNQSSPAEEFQKGEVEVENPAEISDEVEQVNSQAEMVQNPRDFESQEQQYLPRRSYQNYRGGRGGGGGGRRGYSNGRGGRNGPRGGGGGSYQNGRGQYNDQPGNYYQRNYHNNRGRGGRGAGGGNNSYNNQGSGVQASHVPANS